MSVKELIALAKARPGQLNFSTGATGGSTHLAPELFKAMTGVDMVRVIYTSGAVETGDLLSGQVQLTFGSGSLMPHVKTGRLRALAVTSAQPSALFPNIPTIASTVPGYESVGIFGILAPPQTPAAIVNRLHLEIVRVINRPETKERLLGVGQEVIGSSPEQYAATIKDELTKWTKVFKDAGIKPQ
jgi:tripartite-type tricarboxylate transporter receptor subunit TctC